MASTPLINSENRSFFCPHFTPPMVRKWALIAVATIMALGALFAYTLGAPWFIAVGLFALALAPLCPLTTVSYQNREPIQA